MENILFFDGVCILCNGLVDFALKHDRKRMYKFATLQGETAKKLVPAFVSGELHTVVLVDEAGTHTQSDAIIGLLVGLGGIFKIASLLKIFPKTLRDYGYRVVARNRYRWFGTRHSCRIPTQEEKDRILD